MPDVDPFEYIDHGSTFDIQMSQVTPNQGIREIIQNMFESGANRGIVTIDPDLAAQGIYKLMFIDDGPGMEEPKLREYIGSLSSGAKIRGRSDNYGIGCRIATAEGNPNGVRYTSWTDVKNLPLGTELMFGRGDNGRYGPMIAYDSNGDPVTTWDSTIKPPSIIKSAKQGTCVTLMGTDDEPNTAFPKESDVGNGKWIPLYLNRRFYQIPEGFSLKAIDFTGKDRSTWGDKTQQRLRDIKGAKHYNNLYSQTRYNGASGSVPLTGATAHWWLLQDKHNSHKGRGKKEGLSGTPIANVTGHFGFLFKDEIYERGDAGVVRRFGILSAAKRVVVYIEPDEAQPDIGRVRISQINGQPLPLDIWQAEFCENMPDEIREAEKEAMKGSNSHLDQSKIDSFLRKELGSLPPPPIKVRDPNGKLTMVGGCAGQGTNTGVPTCNTGAGGGGSGTGGGGASPFVVNTLGVVPASLQKPPPKKKSTGLEIRWINGGQLEDFAAEYQPNAMLPNGSNGPAICLNEDYYLFTELKRAASEGRDTTNIAALANAIDESLTTQTGLRIARAVSMVKHLARSETSNWNKQGVRNRALSKESLTALIEGSRKDILDEMNKGLGHKFKKAAA